MVFTTAFITLYKLFTFKNGGLTIVSLAVSGSTTYYLKALLNGTDIKNLIIPVLILVIGLFMYLVFLLADMHTGIRVAKHISFVKYGDNRPYTKSYKLYRTLWKLLGVLLLSILLMVTSIMTEIMGMNWVYKTMITFQGAVWLLACGFEVHSIGENHLKRYGYKPKIFMFFDRILTLFENNIAKRVDDSFTAVSNLEAEYKELEEKDNNPNKEESNEQG